MSYTVAEESFDTLASHRDNPSHHLLWNAVFVLPAWMKVWWQTFGSGAGLFLRSVRQGEQIIGIAPLRVSNETASFIGSADICDYLDFVVAPGMEKAFFTVLLDDLKQNGINRLDLESLRSDSSVLTYLEDLAHERGYQVNRQQEDVSVEMDLPSTWEEYLSILSTKQRHEVRRKLRRLYESGNISYHVVKDGSAVASAMDTFLKMFTESRQDKAVFLTEQREVFFRSLAGAMAEAGLLRLGILELDALPTAAVMGFDYDGCLYLYNSGYDLQFDYLSAGLLSKVLCIKESIREGNERFDFLRGGEIYKYRLGGREIPIYRCRIDIE